MERKKFIRVPINKKAKQNYDLGILREDELETLVLSDDQFQELYKMGVFDIINKKCDIIIDEFKDVILMINTECNITIHEYKDEILELDRTPAAIEILTKLISENDNADLVEIKKMLELAVSLGTIVGFDF